jgi:hypothetical protein
MDRRITQVAKKIGARHVATLPNVGGGAFGMARFAQLLHSRLAPSTGRRPGRPTNELWTERPKVPMSAETLEALRALSSQLSNDERQVSPMQLAAQLLEDSISQFMRTSGSQSKSLKRKS